MHTINISHASFRNAAWIEPTAYLEHGSEKLQEHNKENFIKSLDSSLEKILLDKLISQADFARAIQFILKADISEAKIVIEFGVNKSTIRRWVKGKSLPHSMVRPIIIKDLKNIIIEKNPQLFNNQAVSD